MSIYVLYFIYDIFAGLVENNGLPMLKNKKSYKYTHPVDSRITDRPYVRLARIMMQNIANESPSHDFL